MPDDRFLHPRLGHSEKVNQLTELEFRVWIQYQLSADDCGVLRCSGMTIQAANDRLAKLNTKRIDACLTRLVEVGLVQTFQHQGRTYLYQRDWQDWQKVRYPRASLNPAPDAETLAACSEATQKLFRVRAEEVRRRSGNVSEIDPQPTRAGGRETATASGNGSRREEGSGEKPAPLTRNHRNCMGLCSERICLLARQFEDFVGRLGGDRVAAQTKIRRWAEDVLLAWNEGDKRDLVIQGDTFKWWNARYEEWQGSPQAQKGAAKLPVPVPWICTAHNPPCSIQWRCQQLIDIAAEKARAHA